MISFPNHLVYCLKSFSLEVIRSIINALCIKEKDDAASLVILVGQNPQFIQLHMICFYDESNFQKQHINHSINLRHKVISKSLVYFFEVSFDD